LSEIRVKEIKPLPERLPEGERVLWQRSPAWRPYSRRVFQIDKFAIYFALMVLWVVVTAYMNTGNGFAVLAALAWSGALALAVLGMLALVAWLYAINSVFTITNKRVVMQSGLAFQTAVNLPFSKINSADLATFEDGTGDIEILMGGPRLLYSMIWPNVRLFKLKRPVPVLRALPEPQLAAETLRKALAADQPAEKSVEKAAQSGREPELSGSAAS
jgi:hypothetical protein